MSKCIFLNSVGGGGEGTVVYVLQYYYSIINTVQIIFPRVKLFNAC